jgi:SSS family solute:Na+ symporter
VLFAAILAAAMSSLDSALNSLSAATMRDFVEPHFTTPEDPVATQASMLRWSKVTTVAWGAAMTGFAFLVGDMADNVVEGINKVGSLFYGPILAAFMAGILDRRSRGNGVIAGVAVGVLANMWLWLSLEDGMFWMWWNLTGLVVAAVTTAVVSRALPPPDEAQLEKTTLKLSEIPARESSWLRLYGWLFIYFLFIVFIAAKAPDILQSLGTQ